MARADYRLDFLPLDFKLGSIVEKVYALVVDHRFFSLFFFLFSSEIV